jgi:hypothetical protein
MNWAQGLAQAKPSHRVPGLVISKWRTLYHGSPVGAFYIFYKKNLPSPAWGWGWINAMGAPPGIGPLGGRWGARWAEARGRG